MHPEKWKLYLEAFCGLVVPFPRLAVLRARPDLITDLDEYMKMQNAEREYYRRKAEAAEKFYAFKDDAV